MPAESVTTCRAPPAHLSQSGRPAEALDCRIWWTDGRTNHATGHWTRREDEITTYLLSTYPQTSADYLRLYREAGLTIEHSEQNDRSSRAYQRAYAVINTEDVEFDVYLDASSGVVEPELLNLAVAVLSRIVELDAAARAVQTDPRYEESLAYVDITREEIELHYDATTVNTEWGAYFVQDQGGDFIFDTLG